MKTYCLTYDMVDHNCAIPLRRGNCIVVYSDKGPLGPCGQSMCTTCPHTYLYWFPDEDTMKAKLNDGTIGRRGSRPRIEYVVIGDYGTGQMWVCEWENDKS